MMNRKLDPELMAYFFDIKQQISAEHQAYLAAHPEIKQLLTDFMLKVLLTKPENTFDFAKTYFNFFEKRSLRQSLKHLLIVGPSLGGRTKLANRLVQGYPQYFEHNMCMTTQPITAEAAAKRRMEVITAERLEEEAASDNLIELQRQKGEKDFMSKSRLEGVLSRGKVCVSTMEISEAKKLLEKNQDFNIIVVIPGSLETLKERLLNKGRYGLGSIDEAMNGIKHDLEASAKEALFNKRVLNVTVDRSFDQLMLLARIFYKQFKF